MGMDTWYDLQIEELVELTDRVKDVLDEVQGSGAGRSPKPAPRVRELFDLSDRPSDLLKQVRRDE